MIIQHVSLGKLNTTMTFIPQAEHCKCEHHNNNITSKSNFSVWKTVNNTDKLWHNFYMYLLKNNTNSDCLNFKLNFLKNKNFQSQSS